MNIVHDKENARFYVGNPDCSRSFPEYSLSAAVMGIYETYVPVSYRGRGIAAGLVGYAFEYADAAAYRVKLTCPFVLKMMKKNKRYDRLRKKNAI